MKSFIYILVLIAVYLCTASKITGPEASKITGPEASKITGPEASKITGPDASKITGPEASKITGPEASKITGPETSVTDENADDGSQKCPSGEQATIECCSDEDEVSGLTRSSSTRDYSVYSASIYERTREDTRERNKNDLRNNAQECEDLYRSCVTMYQPRYSLYSRKSPEQVCNESATKCRLIPDSKVPSSRSAYEGRGRGGRGGSRGGGRGRGGRGNYYGGYKRCCCETKGSKKSKKASKNKAKAEKEKSEDEDKEIEVIMKNLPTAQTVQTIKEDSEKVRNFCKKLTMDKNKKRVERLFEDEGKYLTDEFIGKITGAAIDKLPFTVIYENFKDYIEINKCINGVDGDKPSSGKLDTKRDLKTILSMDTPELTLEIFGHPHHYIEDIKFIINNIDDSVFGENAFFCQHGACNKHEIGDKADKNVLKGLVELFVPPYVAVKIEGGNSKKERIYQPAAAYTIKKTADTEFFVEKSEKDVSKVIVETEEESFSLAKDNNESGLKKLTSICASKGSKAQFKSSKSDQEWDISGEACATLVDDVTEVSVTVSDKDADDMYTFDIGKDGHALPLQKETFDDDDNKKLLEEYKRFLGDDFTIQYAKFPKGEPFCLSGSNIPKRLTREVPVDQEVVKCKKKSDGKDSGKTTKKRMIQRSGKKRRNASKRRNLRHKLVIN